MNVKLNEYLYILQMFLDREIQDNFNYATLFRSRSTVIDMIKFYNIDGEYHEYLRSVILIPMINKLNSLAMPDERGQPADVSELSGFLLRTIIDNIQKCPLKIIYTCNMLKRHVSKKYYEHWREIVGGYFFLRIICPALTSPKYYFTEHEWSLIETKHQHRLTLTKDLVEIAKFIQQLSNSIDRNNSNNINNRTLNNNNNNNNNNFQQHQRVILQQQTERIIGILEEISSYHCRFIDESVMSLSVDISERMIKESEELIERSKSELINGNTVEIKKIQDLEIILSPIRESYLLRPSNNDYLVVLKYHKS
ncbi:hypothetical protein PPL_03291 [Heterostelium album PN500]|uniref:Ras-GAP domain-containing protein n=1 Tax=Heterostelium pallidum (strain ATCC 26659 / Pp 5 / PN500) TaxID=670386 RepID=D3B4G6_HETP5|nr:hypothetical protein PPL_03291 [Heterostelium album PN500]EFA84214.1 hypothetical protein PPL_03291 [Heterostelium album PN500]|eukprot:XP_020436330.1 hypothetical protein PPL_03291 [Heterostelium album PN500]